MPPIRTPALILHTFAYGDTSRILRILTPEYGLRSVIAKGARQPKSRFGAVLEPFTEGEAHFNLRERAELFTLTGFTLVRSRQGIGNDLAAFYGASVISEVLLRFGTEEPNPELYQVVTGAMDRLADPRYPGAPTAIHSLWLLVSILGYQPQMSSCIRCGRHIDETEKVGFDPRAGGAVCLICGPSGPLVEPGTRSEIEHMTQGGGWVDLAPSDPVAHGAMLHLFLGTHLASERGLRSLPLFLDQLG